VHRRRTKHVRARAGRDALLTPQRGIHLIGVSTYYATLQELISFLEKDTDILGVALSNAASPPRPSKAPTRAAAHAPAEAQFAPVDTEDHVDQPWCVFSGLRGPVMLVARVPTMGVGFEGGR
jgi:hypothetical protein